MALFFEAHSLKNWLLFSKIIERFGSRHSLTVVCTVHVQRRENMLAWDVADQWVILPFIPDKCSIENLVFVALSVARVDVAQHCHVGEKPSQQSFRGRARRTRTSIRSKLLKSSRSWICINQPCADSSTKGP